LHGGSQERLRRAGTENLPGIAGFGLAAELAVNHLEINNELVLALRDRLLREIPQRYSNVRITGHKEKRLPNHASFIFEYIEGESMLLSLDMKGIAASTGSACSSGSLEASHMLLAMGIPHELAHGSLRLSLGRGNTHEDVDYFLETMDAIVARLRAMSPLKEQGDYGKYQNTPGH
jgi:cysteine desulfurase